MRLAVEVTTCTDARTGIGYYTEHLVDGLLQTRDPEDDLVLISNRRPAPELADRWAHCLRVAGAPVRALWMQRDAPRLLAEAGADVGAFPNYVVPLTSPCPTIVFVHDLAIVRMPHLFTLRKRLLMRPLMRHSLAAASAVATVSEASRQDIASCLGIDAGRVALLPGAPHPSCGLAPPEAVAATRARHGIGRPYLLTVGTLEPRKNLGTLLAAFDRLGGRAAELDLVVVGGRGWHDREMLRALALRRPLGHVHWLGYIPEHELISLYAGAELFVYPSRLEGFGLPVIEAMACGAPVVASDVTALREVAADAACFVPPGDVDALAAAMSRLVSDPAAARAAGEAGRLRARSFSWTRTAAALWELARQTGPARIRGAVRSRREDLPHATGSPAPAPSALPSPLLAPPSGLGVRDWALLATVAYADLFDAPLPVSEALAAGIGALFDEVELRRTVKGPALARHLILHPSGHLALAGRDQLVARHQEGSARIRALLDRHRPTLSLLATLPFVRMLAFSGGTAHKNPGVKPDIDLFVVSAPGRLYTAYSLLFLAAKLTGTREVVCPNYLVDESELAIAYHRDVFTAHQLVSARPISGADTYLKFWRANEAWVRPFFPGARPRGLEAAAGRPWLQRAAELALLPLGSTLERVLRESWRFHLRRRAARARRPDVVMSAGILKLHLSDYRRRTLDRFAERLGALRARLEGAGAHAPSDLATPASVPPAVGP
jgi:glycosyltransferase involved in cell wall biosynthesis